MSPEVVCLLIELKKSSSKEELKLSPAIRSVQAKRPNYLEKPPPIDPKAPSERFTRKGRYSVLR